MNTVLKTKYDALLEQGIDKLDFQQQIAYLTQHFSEIVFSTSFSYEDQAITFLLKNEPVEIFTLDTGRLFEQTYETWNRTVAKYKVKIKTYTPPAAELSAFLTEKGPDSFYQSVENRKQCCNIRKVIPLNQAIQGKQVWITGLRAEHSPNRKDIPVFEWDETHQIIKFNPILFWTTDQVQEFITNNQIPYNSLHKKGFVSIGCAPCTRAIQEGEDFRAGRWWWEDASKKECGLHIHK
ncbi:phosphoadenylyl-sulfate reductase [Flavobacterium agricola]|uniref:Adenosine 5'-phosphosulfate reductase n=1 Tax=Flavobacterium agricola TaxID=2870839 RepID=A0ABY6LYJ9_9FLAO|nr:phosphoadenylyl-sulfate reductase [Flavobacterium agricola]UYW01261.1 phosphoadenylyl-sulfate reductase [Flavobacterium agricola]